jgi:hypothetical protein
MPGLFFVHRKDIHQHLRDFLEYGRIQRIDDVLAATFRSNQIRVLEYAEVMGKRCAGYGKSFRKLPGSQRALLQDFENLAPGWVGQRLENWLLCG